MRNTQEKLAILADAAKYDASCASSGSKRDSNGKGVGNSSGMGICHSYTPDGRCVSLLKILLTNYCIYDCVFCVNRSSSDTPRARFSPEEVVALTLDFYRANCIEGLFLSSGIIQNPDYTMEQLIRVARLLREVHFFGGYIHLKAIPGAAQPLIEEAGRWADRLSANIELPTQQELTALAPEKNVGLIEGTMGQIHTRSLEIAEDRKHRLRSAPRFAPAGQSTQMVVGATPSPDRQVLETAAHLYTSYKLRRIYYSGFSPHQQGDPRLPMKPAPLLREHRLYQADWLMRYYDFKAEELTTPDQPDLDLNHDPKTRWALRHREFFPVDINKSAREALLRVPGIGYRNVARILTIRKYHRLTLADLRKLNVRLATAKPFVITDDHLPTSTSDQALKPSASAESLPAAQLDLFQSAALQAVTGEIA